MLPSSDDPAARPGRSRRAALLPWALLLSAALPLTLLLTAVGSVLGGSLDEQYAVAAAWNVDGSVPGPPQPWSAERIGVALAAVSTTPSLLACTLGLLALAALALVGRGHLAPARPVRLLGAATGLVLALTAAAAGVATALGLEWSGSSGFDPSWSSEQAPVLGPLVFVTVFAATSGAVLLRPGRW